MARMYTRVVWLIQDHGEWQARRKIGYTTPVSQVGGSRDGPEKTYMVLDCCRPNGHRETLAVMEKRSPRIHGDMVGGERGELRVGLNCPVSIEIKITPSVVERCCCQNARAIKRVVGKAREQDRRGIEQDSGTKQNSPEQVVGG